MKVILLSILLLVTAVSSVVAQNVSGVIVSCGGWSLGRTPELRKFIKTDVENGAGLYKKLQVEFIPHKPAVLSIYDANGGLVEELNLKELSTSQDALHTLLVEKGFVRKTPEELQVERAALEAERAAEEARYRQEMEIEYDDDFDDDDDDFDDDDDDFDDDDDDEEDDEEDEDDDDEDEDDDDDEFDDDDDDFDDDDDDDVSGGDEL